MIARIWKGETTLENFETYTSFLKNVAIPDYNKTVGFLGLSFIRKKSASVGYFKLTTYWKNLEVIKNFAGEDFEKAKYYPEDVHYLLEFNETVEHFEVFANTFIDIN